MRIGHSTIFYLEKNKRLNQISLDLKKAEVIGSTLIFKVIVKLKLRFRDKIHIKYGEYEFKDSDTMLTVIDKIVNNKVYYRSITFPEGLSNKSIFRIIESNDFLSGKISAMDSIGEGTLLTETYYFRRDDSRNSIIESMQKGMEDFIDENWNRRYPNPLVKTKHEALILASIVEKESSNSFEKKLIASVFFNRLARNMHLQSDPTAIYSYALGNVEKEKEIKTSILIRKKSPYNTYKIKGLPPTPICNPSRESLMAVLQPIKSDYLFFVSNGKGSHNFSLSYTEHRKFVDKLRKTNGEIGK
jgi:UPF0755 protein